jgi:fumarate reductase subunit D
MRRFRYEYGAGPLHLLTAMAAFAIAGFAVLMLSEAQAGSQLLNFVLWFVGAILVHDLVLFPLYSGIDRLVLRGAGVHRARPDDAATPSAVSAINHVRVPFLLSGLFFVVWFPLILGVAEQEYAVTTGQSTEGYLERWLLLTGALFLLSGIAFAVRLARARAGGARAETDR